MSWRIPSLGKVVRTLAVAKQKLGVNKNLGVLNLMAGANRATTKRQAMDPTLRAEVASYFSDDVKKLESLLGRDLSAWGCQG